MSEGSQAAIDALAAIIKDMKLKLELTEIAYRIDYEDYQISFGDTHHCEIQEKIINDFMEFKHADAKRQIVFKLNHLTPWEDWERKEPPGGRSSEDGPMSVDKDI